MGSPRITDSVDKYVLDSCCSCVASGAVLFACQFVCLFACLSSFNTGSDIQGLAHSRQVFNH